MNGTSAGSRASGKQEQFVSHMAPRRVAAKYPMGAQEVRAVAMLASFLLVHALVWTVAAWLSRGNLDMSGDMVENYVWGIEWQAGYAKHPPLFAWVTAAWFRIFPHTDLAYFALSAFNAMIGLFGISALATRFLPRRLALLAGCAMAVSPLYSTLAVKFNANAILLSVWPWTAYCFVRFMQGGGLRCAFALGALAGAALLGKYFSVVLLAALLLAGIVRPDWRVRLYSWRVLAVVLAGVVVLAPHAHWLWVNHFPTFGYARTRTGGTLAAAVSRLGIYALAQVAYLGLSFVFVVLLVRERRRQAMALMIASLTRSSTCPDLWWLVSGPMMVVAAIAVLSRTEMASVWGMAQWFAIVPLWLTALDRVGIAVSPGRAVAVFAGYWLIVLAASTAVGYSGALGNTDDATEPRAELAATIDARWRAHTGKPVPVISGSVGEAQSVAFYSNGHARYWDMRDGAATPWLVPADLKREGAVFVCPNGDTACLADSAAFAGVEPIPVVIRRHAWGRDLHARTYWLFMVWPGQRPGKG